jgi:hypothetical protein
MEEEATAKVPEATGERSARLLSPQQLDERSSAFAASQDELSLCEEKLHEVTARYRSQAARWDVERHALETVVRSLTEENEELRARISAPPEPSSQEQARDDASIVPKRRSRSWVAFAPVSPGWRALAPLRKIAMAARILRSRPAELWPLIKANLLQGLGRRARD